jgi:hypothetical protein
MENNKEYMSMSATKNSTTREMERYEVVITIVLALFLSYSLVQTLIEDNLLSF